VVVRDVLVEDDDQMLDRGSGDDVAVTIAEAPILVVGQRGRRRQGKRRRETTRYDWMLHYCRSR
jgi:hypothetical protein